MNILKILQNLDQSMAHGHDMISIWMIKMCGSPVCKPLQLIFNSVVTPKKTCYNYSTLAITTVTIVSLENIKKSAITYSIKFSLICSLKEIMFYHVFWKHFLKESPVSINFIVFKATASFSKFKSCPGVRFKSSVSYSKTWSIL